MRCNAFVILLLLAMLAMGAGAWAQQPAVTIVHNDMCYRVLDGDSTVSLVSIGEAYGSESVVVPSQVGNYSVVAIESDAFSHCQEVTGVVLPASLQVIGDGVFNACESLTTLFSHVPDANVVLPHVPAGTVLAVDADYRDSYSQFNGVLKTLVNVDDEPLSASLCDVNNDGVVTSADVTVVYNRLLGNSVDPADASGDGVVTSVDITVIYNAMLSGNTGGMGDKGFCFAGYNSASGHVSVRVVDSLALSVGSEMCFVAHDNERAEIVTSGLGVMKGPLPRGGISTVNGIPVISLNNKSYSTGTTAPVVMFFDFGADTIYYKDVQVEVARHVVTDTLRVLSIGNSFSLDALSYVPFIMKAVAPEVYLDLGVMYIGGGTLEMLYNAIETSDFRYYWSYGARPWNERLNVAMTETLTSQPWDVILLQQQSSASRDYGTYQPYLNQLIAWVDEHAVSEHQLAWLITPSFPDGHDRLPPDSSSVQMCERILDCVEHVIADTHISLLLPCGTAIQNARTTPLDSLGDFGHLFDHLHLQDGIPCLIEAYTACAALLNRYGLSHRVWTDSTWVNYAWLKDKNVQEINGAPVGMSEENRAIAKQCAIKALESPLSITTIIPTQHF